MSITTTSLRDQIATRRRQLYAERSFILPLTGYEGLLVGRYRALGYEQLREVGKRNEALADTAEGEVAIAADTLVEACTELLECRDDGYASLAPGWTADAIREHFVPDLPPGTTAKEAIHWVFPSTQLMLHFAEYDEAMRNITDSASGVILGESAGPSEGAS